MISGGRIVQCVSKGGFVVAVSQVARKGYLTKPTDHILESLDFSLFFHICQEINSNSHYEIFYNISNSSDLLSVVDNFVFHRIS